MMPRLPLAVSSEGSQTAVGSAIGVAHEKHLPGLMEPDGHTYLFQDEVALEVIARRRQSSGSSGHNNHVGTLNSLALHELIDGQADTLVKTAQYGGIGNVGAGLGIEVEDF